MVQLLVPYHYAYVVPLLSPYYKNRKESYIQIKTEPSEPRQGDLPELYCDPALALKELNWKSEYGIDEVFMQHNELKMHFVYQMCRDTWNFIQSMLQYKIQKEAHKSFRKSRRLHQQMIRTTGLDGIFFFLPPLLVLMKFFSEAKHQIQRGHFPFRF